jgi:S1-C subfamily serine protease
MLPADPVPPPQCQAPDSRSVDRRPGPSWRLLVAVTCCAAGLLLVASVLPSLTLWKVQKQTAVGQADGSPTPPATSTPSIPINRSPEAATALVPVQGPAPSKPLDAQRGDNELSYRWKDGQQYAYRFFCKAQIGETLLESTGTNTYTIGRSPDAIPLPEDSEGGRGSGTAFVVSPDGYLVTCDHVVRGATDIKVKLGDQTVPCKVVASDKTHDVAVLHVDRHDLPALPLADSESVELAEDVRAIGYPLSDVLGSSVKVTQGSISGIVSKSRGKIFQIDAVVNPGNSGGPLLDGRGAVIGVVNAQLVGMRISKIGFAVPINYAKALLTQHRVSFQTAAAADKLDGPTLAKRVTPAVGLVTMTCHSTDSVYLDQDQPTLYYHAVLDRYKRLRGADDSSPAAIDSSERDDGNLSVDDYGEVGNLNGGHVNLPCLLGPLATVAIHPLPASGEKTWTREDTVSVVTSGSRATDPLARIRPPGFPVHDHVRMPGPFWATTEESDDRCPVVQQVTYSADKAEGTKVVIHKSLKLKSIETAGVSPRVELTGQGETIFDLRAGVPQHIDFSGTFTLREAGQMVQAPVTLKCDLIAEGEPQPTPEPSTPAPVLVENPESVKARLDGFLTDLRAADRDWSKCFQALQGLSMMKPVEARQDEVAKVLDNYLADKNYSARSSALRAIQVWGTQRNVPTLIQLLKPSESSSLRQRAIEVLGNLADPRAAMPIAERVKDPADQTTATRALRALGGVGEDAAISLLADQDATIHDIACKVLAEIGGPKSVAALKEYADKGDGPAKAALEILLRQQQ